MPAMALQVVEGVEGNTLFVNVSARDLNRIAIEGGRIRRVKAADDALLAGSSDDVTGQALIQPLVKDPFSIFVFSQSGKTYTLVLQPKDIPGESIIIREQRAESAPSSVPGEIERATSYQQAIKRMLQALAGERTLDGAETKKTWEEIRLWKGSRFALEQTIVTHSMIGERYRLINVSDQPMRIAEQEFYKKGVLAVAVQDLNLDPGRGTTVYVIKRNAGVR
jgi:conjugal transfer pilus assembly protein TraK